MHAITIARRKLATQNLRFLSHLAKHLGVYHRAANFLAGHPEHTAAQVKSALIDASKHLIIKSVHPSPLSASRGFFGSKHFSQANAYLAAHGIAPIDWQL